MWHTTRSKGGAGDVLVAVAWRLPSEGKLMACLGWWMLGRVSRVVWRRVSRSPMLVLPA